MAIGTFHTPPANQGQIVEISYTQIDGTVIRRTYDRNDRSTIYHASKAHLKDEGDYWNGEPSNTRWKKITEADAERMREGGN